MKEKLLDEMPVAGKKIKKEPIFQIVSQEGEFDDEEEDEEFRKFLMIQIEEKEKQKINELQEKRERYVRLSRMWVKILDYYSNQLNEREITRIAENLYFNRCEDFDARQLARLEKRAITIIHNFVPCKIPNARKMPNGILKISIIDKKRWIDPQKVKRKYDFYGTINQEIEDEDKFNYLYNKARELGPNQTSTLDDENKEMEL